MQFQHIRIRNIWEWSWAGLAYVLCITLWHVDRMLSLIESPMQISWSQCWLLGSSDMLNSPRNQSCLGWILFFALTLAFSCQWWQMLLVPWNLQLWKGVQSGRGHNGIDLLKHAFDHMVDSFDHIPREGIALVSNYMVATVSPFGASNTKTYRIAKRSGRISLCSY